MFKPLLIATVLIALTGIMGSGCYMYREQGKALVPNIDIDQTLNVAELELEENKFSRVLTLWAIRDQIITKPQAQKVSNQYFEYIDRIDSEEQKARGFSVWHLTWAIANMYRFGDENVKAALERAYKDAEIRVDKLDKRIATEHFKGEKILSGDAHAGGRAFAKSHIVAPGNDKYLQSVQEYKNAN
jgi:hypothetical protein